MKKIYTVLVMLVIVLTNANAQSVVQRTYTGDLIAQNDVVWSESDQTYIMASCGENGELFVTKTTPTGYPVWNMQYIISGGGIYGKPDVVVTATGDFFICGTMQDMTMQGVIYYLIAAHSWGESFWSKIYSTPSLSSYNYPSLQILPDGNMMITESVYGHVGYIKVSPIGDVIVSNIYREDPGAESKTPGFASDVFPDGSMIFTGKRNCDIMLVKTDASGQMQWSRVMNAIPTTTGDTTFGSYYHTKDVLALADGSALECGFDNYAGFLMHTSATGNILWYRRLAFNPNLWNGSCFYEMKQVDATHFIVAGIDSVAFLAKFDINGNVLSAVQTYEPGYFYGYGGANVCVNPAGKIAWPLTIYDPNYVSVGNSIVFMDDISSNGCSLNSITLNFESSSTIVEPTMCNIPVFTLPQNIAAVAGVVTDVLHSINYGDWCSVVATNEQISTENSLVIRNTLLDPSTPLYFSLGNFTGDIVYSVTDMNGRLVFTSSQDVAAEEVVATQAGLFSAGMYVLTVEAGDKMYAEKFVVRE